MREVEGVSLNNPQPHLSGGPESPHNNKQENQEGEEATAPPDHWVERARKMYASSEDWFNANIREQMERNLDNLAGRHPAGSKYHTDTYRHRSKIFRPKMRTAERENEAAVAEAMFSNREFLSVTSANQDDDAGVAGADLVQEIVKARLEEQFTTWYKTVCGAVHDAWSQMCIISAQEWVVDEMLIPQANGPIDEQGAPSFRSVVKKDEPSIRLIPSEYIRFDPASNWLDPLNSSPYLIELIPMHISDVLHRMMHTNVSQSIQPWIYIEPEVMRSATKPRFESTSRARDGNRTDGKNDGVTRELIEHEIVWVHVNIERDMYGRDMIWHTIGTDFKLTDPVPLYELMPHLKPGERQYVMGHGVIEPHRSYPPAMTQLAEGLQQAANEIQNSRFDNVRLAMNRRFRIRRNANVDLKAMRESVPGGAYEVDDPLTDVVEEAVSDVTGSAYEEATRLQLDMDDLTGSFNQGSVAGSRGLGDTVGGMNLAREKSSSTEGFQTRTIIYTWAQPALDQYTRMIQFYESDENIMALAGRRAKKYQKFLKLLELSPDSLPSHELLTIHMSIHVSVAHGDPQTRARNLFEATEAGKDLPGVAPILKGREIMKELYSAAGFDNGDRFLEETDTEEYETLMGELREMQKQIETDQVKSDARLQETRMKLAHDEAKLRFEAMLSAEKDDRERETLALQRDSLIWNMYMEEYEKLIEMERLRFEQRSADTDRQVTAAGVAAKSGGNGSSGGSNTESGNQALSAIPGEVGTMARDKFDDIPYSIG